MKGFGREPEPARAPRLDEALLATLVKKARVQGVHERRDPPREQVLWFLPADPPKTISMKTSGGSGEPRPVSGGDPLRRVAGTLAPPSAAGPSAAGATGRRSRAGSVSSRSFELAKMTELRAAMGREVADACGARVFWWGLLIAPGAVGSRSNWGRGQAQTL